MKNRLVKTLILVLAPALLRAALQAIRGALRRKP